MHSVDYNLGFLEATLRDLEDYLLGPEIYWQMARRAPAGMPPYPSLTLGGLKLVLDELRVQESEMDAAQSGRLHRLESTLEGIHRRWVVAWERKAARELGSRANLFRAYLVDLEEGEVGVESYPHEVRNRVMAERLVDEAMRQPEGEEAIEGLQALDARLRARFKPGPFIWGEPLRRVYPRTTFWFLYGLPRQA